MRLTTLMIVIGLISIFLVGCATDNIDTTKYEEKKSVSVPREQSPVERQAAEKDTNPEGEGLMTPDNEVEEVGKEIVVMKTSKGTIEIQMNRKLAPVTVSNFMTYVNEGFYDGTVFHRVIDGFMIQGGGFTEDGSKKKTHGPISLESKNGLKNKIGTIAMARTMDPNSATSQFFINVADNAMLDYAPGNDGYAVFGKVVSGMDVVEKIKSVPTGMNHGMGDWPNEEVVIESVKKK